jgi:tetratricopeptide (TPR) repeat protein
MVIVAAGLVAYSNSLQGEFVFDDVPAIVENSSIRTLARLDEVLLPVEKYDYYRPVVNLSLALCYSVGGLNTVPYHCFNLAIHIGAALSLFGLTRRTLLLCPQDSRLPEASTALAFVTSLLWMLHPLQTESVTYVVQRCEAMFGFFTLSSLYCVVRGATSAQTRWYVGAVTACALGMGSKEATAVTPLLILLVDRTFLASSLREIVQKRWGLYVGLAMTWGMLAPSILMSRSGRLEPAMHSVTAWEYARTQFGVVMHYLQLSFWPAALCLDYRWPVAESLWDIVPPAAGIGVLLLLVLWALWRHPKWGFLGAWFFLTIAPSSSVVPILDLAFEHRMYLPLASLVVAVVVGSYVAMARLSARNSSLRPTRWAAGVCLSVATAITLGILTYERNHDYQTGLQIWQDTVTKAPGNPRAHANLGAIMAEQGSVDEAIACYRKASEIEPGHAESYWNDLGYYLLKGGRVNEAVVPLRKALEIQPDYANAHNNLGRAWTLLGQFDEAAVHYRRAAEIEPGNAQFQHNMSHALVQAGRVGEAIRHCQIALELRKESLGERHPDYAATLNNLGLMYQSAGDQARAEALTRQATAIWKEVLGDTHPDYAASLRNLASIYRSGGDGERARSVCLKVLEINPGDAQAHCLLGVLFRDQAKDHEAVNHWREALRLQPDQVPVLLQTAWVLATSSEVAVRNGNEAIKLAQRAIQVSGSESAGSLDVLAAAYAETGRFPEAVATARRALAAIPAGETALASLLQDRLQRYESGSAFHEYRQVPTSGGTTHSPPISEK